jgi:iron complex outermembrane receptor protein
MKAATTGRSYLDAESNLTSDFLLGAAIRYEDYSRLRYHRHRQVVGAPGHEPDLRDPQHGLHRLPRAGRAAVVLRQRSTNLNAAGVLTDTLTARQDSDVTRAFGIEPLKEEESTAFTLGLAWKPNEKFALTIDIFQIDINDRIIFSSNIQPEDPATCGPRTRAARSARSSIRSAWARCCSSPTRSIPRPKASTSSPTTTPTCGAARWT